MTDQTPRFCSGKIISLGLGLALVGPGLFPLYGTPGTNEEPKVNMEALPAETSPSRAPTVVTFPNRTPSEKASEKGALIDGTAATVGKQLITVRQAAFFYALMRFRDGESGVFQFSDPETLRRTVQKMVLEEMVFSEMKSLKSEGGSRTDAENLVRLQRSRGKDREILWQDILNRFSKPESAAVDRLWKSLQVEKFIQKKAETLTPIITEAEVERYYKQNKNRLGSEYESLKPNIVLLLKKERMQKGLEEWVRFLKEKYGVTNHLES